MKKVKCLLCGHDAQGNSFSSKYNDEQICTPFTGGYCYDCPECGLYALDGPALHKVKRFVTDEQKRKLSEYVRTHQLKDKFLPLEWSKIKSVLKISSRKK